MALALANYHPQLREAILSDVPETAGDKAFLSDGALSQTEIAALDRAQSVFGLETFYRAWEMDALEPNEVHAVLHMLTFYDPYTTVHDVTADPDDPDSEGAEITRTLDDFGVYPGVCLYCKGQMTHAPRDYIDPKDDLGVLRRTILLHLAHSAKVQADALSPCDLRDFTEEELVALGDLEERVPSSHVHASYGITIGGKGIGTPEILGVYFMLDSNYVASVRLTDELLGFGIDAPKPWTFASPHIKSPWPDRPHTAKPLIRPGEILRPFTHAMRAYGGAPTQRGLEPCLEAVKAIVDWDRNRYVHFAWNPMTGGGDFLSHEYFNNIFPPYQSKRLPYGPIPTWAWFLVDESGGQDKSNRLMNQFRALNLPAIRQGGHVPWKPGITLFDETAAAASVAWEGINGVLLAPYDLYIHRNIGFGTKHGGDLDRNIVGVVGSEYDGDIDDLVHAYPMPENCRLERRSSEGSIEEALRPSGRDKYIYWVRSQESATWENRGFHDLGFLPENRRRYYTKPMLVYVCN